ncbi:glycosyltransferase family 4 protein [Curtobacterium sp. MCSS17_006]|uniref:glycosyltransferase family 4 protein n=1 Tax=Curtobacterium sp. MCSS17_006 TaxID=2175642 RepID=UPI0015E8A03F|nr:glycosyltransferase family 4 protein [Curtobacterium sp. MCSS17_006]
MNRLFEALGDEGRYRLDVLYRDRGAEAKPRWTTNLLPVLSTQPGRFSRFDQLRWILRTRRSLKTIAHRYRYVHLQGAYITNILAVPRRVRRKLIVLPVLENGDLPRSSGRSRLKHGLYRRVLGEAFLGLALSAGIEESLVALGLPRQRVLRVNNPSGTAHVSEDGSKLSPDEFTIGFVGKIGPHKNPHLVLEALARLGDAGISARVLLVGPFANEHFEREFRALGERLGVSSQITMTGFVDDVQPYLEQMDVFLLPSRHEGMPGALAEAMAFGIPAVVTDVGDMATHVRAAHAGAVVEANSTSIVEALQRLTDPLLRRDLGKRARSYASANFLPAAVARSVQAKIDELEGVGPHEGT